MFLKKLLSLSFLFILLVGCSEGEDNQAVNVYTARLPELVQPVFDAFTEETGIEVNSLYLGKGIVERLKQEDNITKADIVLVSDIGTLEDLKTHNLTQKIYSEEIVQNIPQDYRDNDGQWVGLTRRIRMIAYAPDRVYKSSLSGYTSLGDPAFHGRVCSRSGQHPYNISMIAAYHIHHGDKKADQWLSGFKSNLALSPSGGDRDQIKLIAAGKCDIAPVNHYYYGKMQNNSDYKDILKAVKLLPISDMRGGAYANISGAVLSKYSDNTENALKLLEFMSGEKGQKIFSEVDFELPVNPKTQIQDDIVGGAEKNIKPIALTDIAKMRKDVLKKVYAISFDE
ncbi:MAG: extracellular solute-binding protein [Pseudomonadota bacterium]